MDDGVFEAASGRSSRVVHLVSADQSVPGWAKCGVVVEVKHAGEVRAPHHYCGNCLRRVEGSVDAEKE